MKTVQIAGAALIVLVGCRGALAEPCFTVNRQIYNLTADTVNWSMRVGDNHNCRYGIRYAKVQLETMTLVSPPRSGHVVLQGWAFTYAPKKDFQGDDSFDLEVAGQIQKVRGSSTIHVVVSVRSAPKSMEAAHAAAPAPNATAAHADKKVPVASSGAPISPIKVGQGLTPVPNLPAAGTTLGPVPQLGSGPAPMPIQPQPGTVLTLMPPVPTASSAAPPSSTPTLSAGFPSSPLPVPSSSANVPPAPSPMRPLH
jgi:hypothetical protein